MSLAVQPDLTVTLGRASTRLSVAEGFEMAQTLIRVATRRLVAEEMGIVGDEPAASDPRPRSRR